MKPNHGQNPAPQTHTSLSGLTVRPRWSFPKMSRRILNLSLVLISQAIVHLPGSPVLALEPCINMKEGSSGPSVTALQQTLINSGFNVEGGIDGQFGQNTQIALILYQRNKSNIPGSFLDVDGEVGPETCKFLINEPNSQLADPNDPRIVNGINNNSSLPQDILPIPRAPITTSSGTVPPAPNSSSSVQSGLTISNNPQNKGYHVVVPYRGDNRSLEATRKLNDIQSIVPTAVSISDRRGNTINAGIYNHRYEAETVSYRLKKEGFDARVVFRDY